ncbi:MAG: nucleoside monophosphate kinase [Candidatus Nealsonbacteria bacterium]
MKHFKQPLSIIMYGRPGSGKGTQAALLAKKFKFEHFSSGEALRQRRKVNDFTAKKLTKVLNTGKWVPECTIIKLWMDKLEEYKKKKNFRGWIYDGGPRLDLETKLLDNALDWYEWDKNTKVILIHISERTAFNRLTKRRQCKKCKELIPWVGKFKLIKKCHKCGGELVQRSDDKQGAIQERLNQFRKYTVPQINYFKKKGKVSQINGEQSIEDVFGDVLRAVK